jgi:hypothetical protein
MSKFQIIWTIRALFCLLVSFFAGVFMILAYWFPPVVMLVIIFLTVALVSWGAFALDIWQVLKDWERG